MKVKKPPNSDIEKPILEEEVEVEEIRRHIVKCELGKETLEDKEIAKKAEKVFDPREFLIK